MLLKVSGLTKKVWSKTILDNVNFELEIGKIVGLLGPNGAGKSTFMKVLLGINSYSDGEILFDNKSLSKISNKEISFLPDVNFLDKSMKVKDALDQFRFFYSNFNIEKAKKLLEELNIPENRKIKSLSKGTIEKLNLILILSKDCKLYILDEPIAGVDLLTRKQILKLIIDNIDENSSVIISTHLIKDIEQIFDQVVFVNEGKFSQKYDVEKMRLNNISVENLYLENFGGY